MFEAYLAQEEIWHQLLLEESCLCKMAVVFIKVAQHSSAGVESLSSSDSAGSSMD